MSDRANISWLQDGPPPAKPTARVAVPPGVKTCTSAAEQRIEKCEKNKCSDTKINEEGDEGGTSGSGGEICPPVVYSGHLGEAGALLSPMMEQRSTSSP